MSLKPPCVAAPPPHTAQSRPQCLAQAAAAAQAALEAGTAPPLEMKDMAGIFILHAIGLVAGYVIKITVEVKERYFPKPPKQPGAAPSPYALPHGGRNGHGRGGSHAAGAAAVGGAAGSGGPLQGGPLGSGSAVAGVGADNDVDEEEEEDEAGGLFGGERRSSVGGGMSTRAAGLVRHKVEAMTGQARSSSSSPGSLPPCLRSAPPRGERRLRCVRGALLRLSLPLSPPAAPQMEDLLHEMRQLLESDVGALGRPVLGGHNRRARPPISAGKPAARDRLSLSSSPSLLCTARRRAARQDKREVEEGASRGRRARARESHDRGAARARRRQWPRRR